MAGNHGGWRPGAGRPRGSKKTPEALPRVPDKPIAEMSSAELLTASHNSPLREPPFAAKSQSEQLATLVGQSLLHNHKLLNTEIDFNDLSPGNLKLLAIVTNATSAIIAAQVKIETERFRDTAHREREREAAMREFQAKFVDLSPSDAG